jgi:hypothetical protein
MVRGIREKAPWRRLFFRRMEEGAAGTRAIDSEAGIGGPARPLGRQARL